MSEKFVPAGSVYMEKSITEKVGDGYAKVTVGVMLPINYTREDLRKVEKSIRVVDDIIDDELELQLDEILPKPKKRK